MELLFWFIFLKFASVKFKFYSSGVCYPKVFTAAQVYYLSLKIRSIGSHRQ